METVLVVDLVDEEHGALVVDTRETHGKLYVG
jgi:hypothetical protein